MICLLPLVAALAGWLLHKLLIGFFFTYQLPKLQKPLANEAARYISKETDWHGIAATIADEKHIRPLMPLIEEHLDVLLRKKIKEKVPVLAALMGDKTLDKIKSAVMEELSLALPKLITGLGDNLQLHTKVEDLVRDKIMQMDLQRMIPLWKRSLRKPLRYIALAGALTGFLIGLMLVLLLDYMA